MGWSLFGRVVSEECAMTEKRSWRDVVKVHPAADVFPLLAEDELRELGEDIKANGLKEPVVLWSPGSPADYGLTGHPLDSAFLLDGRNRLSAMEIVGMCIVSQDGRITTPFPMPQVLYGADIDPASYVISKNIHRRHLTKQQQADLIIKAVEAGPRLGNMAKHREPRKDKGRLQGQIT